MKLVLPERELAGIVVTAGALEPLPPEPRAWVERQIAAGAAARALRVRGTRALQTDDGWPLAIVRSDVVEDTPAGERILESRAQAIYQFGVYGAVATARGRVEGRDDLDALFREGRPDFTSERIIALAQVWEGLEETAP